MEKNILSELEKAMKQRNIKVPKLSSILDIPKDRIYKWYQQGTDPKFEDANKIWDWINGIIATEQFKLEEDQAPYGKINLNDYMEIIKSQQKMLEKQLATMASQQEAINKNAETIRSLALELTQSKKAS